MDRFVYFLQGNYFFTLILIPLLLGLWAQAKVSSTFQKYSRVRNMRGLTGADAARMILDRNGITNVTVLPISGNLTDHYDPRDNVIRLSESVYGSASAAAVGVAAHEAGHAVQHAMGYAPMKLRSLVIPAANFGSALSWPLVILGMILASQPLVNIGIILFLFIVLFQLITLPVEFNASRRAIVALQESGALSGPELGGAKKVLTAAALTYVAAFVTSLAQLLRLLLISRNSRR